MVLTQPSHVAGDGNIIITGTPGIGKPLWQFYVMYKLALRGATFVINFKGHRTCFCYSG